MTKEKELKKLWNKYQRMKKKEQNEKEIKRLKQEIWKMEHKGIRKTAGIIENTGKGLWKGTKKLFSKASKIPKNWKKNMKNEKLIKQEKPVKVNNDDMSVKDMLNAIP